MYAQKLETLPPPPGVIGSLKAGFDVVSSHVFLILIPLGLDLFLWLGPRLGISKLLGPVYSLLFEQARRELTTAAAIQQSAAFQGLFNDLLQRFNLVSLVSRLLTFPIGISSLAAKNLPADSPVSAQNVVQVASPFSLIFYMFFLIVIGWAIGGLYFRWVSETSLGHKAVGIGSLRAVIQTIILSVIWFFSLLAISIPILLVLTLLTLISPAVASAALFIMLLLSFWLIVPLFFIPHGIFVRGQNAFYSIFSSFRMARFTLPTSGMFVFSSFILSTGLNYLWSVPRSDSWMTLVGIAGHSFITTALLAASFVYYRDMNVWLQIVIDEMQGKKNARIAQL